MALTYTHLMFGPIVCLSPEKPRGERHLDGAELHKWVHDLANGLFTRPMVREADVLELLDSLDSGHRELALLLIAAKSYQRQTP